VARRKVVAEVKMRKGVPTEAVVFDCAAGQYWSPVEVR
jgi:hypothetical protein